MKRLIVNADDFGLTPGVNAAIVELNRAGALSSATLMASAAQYESAVKLSKEQATLGVGCHVVLTDGAPVLPPGEVPSLLDPASPGSGQFRPTLSGFLVDLMRGRIREAEMEAEAAAQIARIQSAGLAVDHIDTHKHTHIFPRVLRPLLRAARQLGVRAVRNPFEPRWSIRATPGAGLSRRLAVHSFRSLRRPFLRLVRQNGIVTTNGTIGLLATGSLDRAALRALLRSMPDGVWELVCHPGYCDDALNQVRTRLRASREIERAALLEVIPQAIFGDPALELAAFAQIGLVSSGTPAA